MSETTKKYISLDNLTKYSLKMKEYIDSVAVQPVQTDWSQNDETAADYIKNRTHYEAFDREVLVPELTLDFNELVQDSVGFLGSYRAMDFTYYIMNFTIGDKYVIVFDGQEYQFIANDIGCLKDPINYTTAPIHLSQGSMGAMNYYVKEPGTHTVSVLHLIPGAVKQLDEKFIPDTIARTSDIPAVPSIEGLATETYVQNEIQSVMSSLKIVKTTQEDYDALEVKDENTLYIVV